MCVYLKIMISSSLSWRLLYCCKQMLQWSCLGWSPLLTALRRCDKDQWRSEFNRFVVVSNNVWEKERKIIAKVKKMAQRCSRDTEAGLTTILYCMFVLWEAKTCADVDPFLFIDVFKFWLHEWKQIFKICSLKIVQICLILNVYHIYHTFYRCSPKTTIENFITS